MKSYNDDELIRIAELHNAVALPFFTTRSFDDAKKVLVQVIQRLRQLSLTEENDEESTSSDGDHQYHSKGLAFFDDHAVGKTGDDCFWDSLPTDLYFVRCQTDFFIDTNVDNDAVFRGAMRIGNDLPFDVESATAVALYNLALVTHISATTTSGMTTALKLYEQALMVAEHCCAAYDSVAITMMTAAIYNNMAYINSTVLYNFIDVRDMIHHLSDLVVFMLEEYEPYQNESLIIPFNDFDFFLQSVKYSKIIQYDVVAPAA